MSIFDKDMEEMQAKIEQWHMEDEELAIQCKELRGAPCSQPK